MLNQNIHRQYIYKILFDMFGSSISKDIALNWWTLCYLVYWLDRFSTDIDLDMLWWKITKKVVDNIRDILNKYWVIKKETKWNNMYRMVLSYDVQGMNIKIELNNRVRKNNIYEIINFHGLSIRAMDKSSIFANKLVALTDRKNLTSRDLWDIHFFFDHSYKINEKIIEERTWKSSKEYIKFLYRFIEKNFNTKNIVDANLWVVLDDKQKAWVKQHLKQKVLWFLAMIHT